MSVRPITSDDLAQRAAERDVYRCIELHRTHTAASLASDLLPAAPLFQHVPAGCTGACADTADCDCSHRSAPRRPRQPRTRPSILAQLWAFLCQRSFPG